MRKTRTQIRPAISAELEHILREEAARRKQPYGALVTQALEQYFDPEAAQNREAILLKRIDQLERQLRGVNDNVTVIAEVLGIYIRTYLSRLVDIPAEQAQAVHARTNTLFKQFMEQVEESLLSGNSLFNQLPKEDFITDPEAVKMLQQFINKEAGFGSLAE